MDRGKHLIKLKPITEEQYNAAVLANKVHKAIDSIPTPSNGRDGSRGASGRDGKDGVTTTVTREVLANKELLLEKEEFEKFKKQMMRMENDVRESLAKTSGYFGGGGISELVNVIEVSTTSSVRANQLRKDRFNVVLVMTAGITITLPEPDPTKLIWVQQGYDGVGSFTVVKI